MHGGLTVRVGKGLAMADKPRTLFRNEGSATWRGGEKFRTEMDASIQEREFEA